MTLAELAERIGTSPRQIRFLIAEGILPSANKTGRAADAYGEEHLVKAQRYLALHRMGMKPASIKVLMAFDDAATPPFTATARHRRRSATRPSSMMVPLAHRSGTSFSVTNYMSGYAKDRQNDNRLAKAIADDCVGEHRVRIAVSEAGTKLLCLHRNSRLIALFGCALSLATWGFY